jgi:hypothetical protein
MTRVEWPNGKRFAFTVFDDPDAQTVENGKPVYDFLTDCGFRTTKGVWPLAPRRRENLSTWGDSCADPDFLRWCLDLQERGFEIGFHCAAPHTSTREETLEGIEVFAEHFGGWPSTGTNHYGCEESIYWGSNRVTGYRRWLYSAAKRGRNRPPSSGHIPSSPLFWGDICRDRLEYVRNFVFREIDTLSTCPMMPYHDTEKPFVNAWFASSEGSKAESFVQMISEANQEALEESGGACIMYTHFAHGFVEHGRLNPRFKLLLERLAERDGWFVPVRTLLGHLRASSAPHVLTPLERRALERRWLREKLQHGTS